MENNAVSLCGPHRGNQNKEVNKPSKSTSSDVLKQWARPSVLSWRLQRRTADRCGQQCRMRWASLRLPPPHSASRLSPPAMPPQIIQFPEDQKVRAGESVELFGKVTGTQPITCTWMKFRKQVSEEGGGLGTTTQPLGWRGWEMLSWRQHHPHRRGLEMGSPQHSPPDHHSWVLKTTFLPNLWIIPAL